MNSQNRFGYITVGPSDYVIHIRRGRIIRQGLGLSFFCLPWVDRYCVIPGTVQSISFSADQITRENQGVQIEGFAVWKVQEPSRTYLHFDFTRDADPVGTINRYLCQVVESAIRHQIANMTIEDVLRKRASIILELKRELAYISDRWGLALDTIEIKNVKILSEQLFTNMQARFRDAVRLESEASALERDRAIAEQRLRQQEELAQGQQEARRRELARQVEMEALAARTQREIALAKLTEESARQAAELDAGLALHEHQQVNRRRSLEMDEATVASERSCQAAGQTLERERGEHRGAMARLDAGAEAERIAAANREDPRLTLIRALPGLLQGLKIGEINLRDDTLRQLASQLAAGLKTTQP